MRRIILIVLLCYLPAPGAVHAEGKFFQTEFTYTLSDNDTKNDARRFCFLNAAHDIQKKVKTFLLEKYGPGEYQITEEDVDAYLTVMLKIDTTKEEWDYSEEKITVFLAIRTVVDIDYIGRRIQSIKQDPELDKKIKADQQKLNAMEEEYVALHEKLGQADADAGLVLRKEKQIISMEMDRMESIEYIISTKTRHVADKILTGMTVDEVIDIAGQPRATATCKRPDFLNYGNFWVGIDNGVVVSTIPIDKWSGPCYRYGAIDRGGAPGAGSRGAGDAPQSENAKFVIVLKDGKTIPTPIYYQIEDVIYYKRYGGIIGIEEEKVREIKKLE